MSGSGSLLFVVIEIRMRTPKSDAITLGNWEAVNKKTRMAEARRVEMCLKAKNARLVTRFVLRLN